SWVFVAAGSTYAGQPQTPKSLPVPATCSTPHRHPTCAGFSTTFAATLAPSSAPLTGAQRSASRSFHASRQGASFSALRNGDSTQEHPDPTNHAKHSVLRSHRGGGAGRCHSAST